MITKRSKGYVPYLYTKIKYESITVYIENKTGKALKRKGKALSKETLFFKYVPKE